MNPNKTIKMPLKLYHGSTELYSELRPYGIDLGNAFQDPGWSLYCYIDKDSSIGWTIFQVLKKLKRKYPESSINIKGCYKSKSAIIDYDTFEYLKGTINGYSEEDLTYYIYTIKTEPDFELGLGHSSNTNGCVTIRTDHIKPSNIETRILNIKDIKKHCIIRDKDIDKGKADTGINTRLLTFLMTNDYMYNMKVRSMLNKDIKAGLLEPGDDLNQYMKDKGIEMRKVTMKDRIFSESVEYDAEFMKSYQYPLPSILPYFTPDEMENMGVFSEDAEKNYYGVKVKNPYAKEWFDTYKATGNPGANYIQKLLPVIDKKMKEPSYEHKQELLEWGWNPEIGFSDKVKPRMEQTREKLLEHYGVQLVSLVEEAEDDPFLIASLNIAKMCKDETSKIGNTTYKENSWLINFYTIADELSYSNKNHDKIIIGHLHYFNDDRPGFSIEQLHKIAQGLIDRVNSYLATQNSLYIVDDIDPNIIGTQEILTMKREIAGQDNIAESTDGGRTIENDTPEVIDASEDNHKSYEDKERIDSLDDFYSRYKDEGNSTVEGDNSEE